MRPRGGRKFPESQQILQIHQHLFVQHAKFLDEKVPGTLLSPGHEIAHHNLMPINLVRKVIIPGSYC